MSGYNSVFLVDEFVFTEAGDKEFILDLDPFNIDGFFSLQGKGAHNPDDEEGPDPFPGVIDVAFKCSNNGIDFVTPTGAQAVMENLGDADELFVSFAPPPCRYLKLIFSADDVITASFWLALA
jgi:hypothetical protein